MRCKYIITEVSKLLKKKTMKTSQSYRNDHQIPAQVAYEKQINGTYSQLVVVATGGHCVVTLLKDGRWNILNGPVTRWTVVEELTEFEHQILLAFCEIKEESQERMQQFMVNRCRRLEDVLAMMPQNNVTWKHEFLKALCRVQERCLLS